MTDETNNELLSAYLDGELSADERQRVEQLLAENAECRQVYEELRALRASLQSLPRHKLADDLGEKVLRLAEQAKLGTQNETGGMSTAERRSRLWRAIIYPLLAVAAAVALMINSAKEKDKHDHQIARAPMKQSLRAEMSAPAEQEVAGDDSPAADFYRAQESAQGKPSDLSATVNSAKLKSLSGSDSSQMPASSAGSGSEPAADSSSLSDAEQAADRTAPAGAKGAIRAGIGGEAASESFPAKLIVNCKLTSTAIQAKAFDALLTRNHLVPRPAAERLATKPSDEARESAGQSDRLDDSYGKTDRAEKLAEARMRSRRDEAWSQNVVVELDAQQLVALLADLQNHPDQFLSVELPGQRANARRPASRRVANNFSSKDFNAGEEAPVDDAATAPALAAPAAAPAATAKPAAADAAGPSAGSAKADESELRVNAESQSPQRVRVLFRLSAAAGD